MRFLTLILACLCLVAPLRAQKQKREPLTPAQIDELRDLGILPNDRVKFYTKILDEHADVIKGLTNRAKSAARSTRLDGELQDLTSIMDELGSNLDVASERHSDIRNALKELSEASPRWLRILRALAGETGFDVSRKEAIESGEDLVDQATRLLTEQDDYFKAHKGQEGQERAEPK